MPTREEIEDYLEITWSEDDEFLLADGFDDAFIGTVQTAPNHKPVAVYCAEKCIQILMDDGMELFEAREFFEFNTLCAYVGELTPVFVWPMTEPE